MEKDEVEILEPTGTPKYKHDFYNETDKAKVRSAINELLEEFLKKGGEIKKVKN